MMLSKLEEEGESNGGQRESLKDRFKALRMREEAGIQLIAAEGDQPAEAVSVISPGADSQAGNKQLTPVLNPSEEMAPGTASGVNAGPSAMPEAQVDWDLWQSVVYEGPAAVARTSPEELNRAIATGIPNAIRGVIWQVLAQSKNEQLESVYKELIATGTDNEKPANHGVRSVSVASSSHGASSAVDDVKSSASSVHSNQSAMNGITSPQSEKSEKSLDVAKVQASSDAERKKRHREDEARLQKLEKTIRRDLGARTSFSKYAAAAGLQEGLFGVCKAYALYDEGVGYAQGMNFLIMPLLFNVSMGSGPGPDHLFAP